jgi:hypothetical protein
MFMSFADGTFAALAVLPVALVFFLAYGHRPSRARRPNPARVQRRRAHR